MPNAQPAIMHTQSFESYNVKIFKPVHNRYVKFRMIGYTENWHRYRIFLNTDTEFGIRNAEKNTENRQ